MGKEEFTEFEIESMPECTCPGQDPFQFRHFSHCALRYWHDYRSLGQRCGTLEAELAAIEKALPHLLGFRMYPMFDAKGTFSQEKANEWSKRVGDFHAALQRPGGENG